LSSAARWNGRILDIVTELGADPFLSRLRDTLGVLRIVYLVTEDERERMVLKKAGDALDSASSVATSRRREKELGLRLRRANRALHEAAEAALAPGAGVLLRGALARMPKMKTYW